MSQGKCCDNVNVLLGSLEILLNVPEIDSFAVFLFTNSIRRQGLNNYSDTDTRSPLYPDEAKNNIMLRQIVLNLRTSEWGNFCEYVYRQYCSKSEKVGFALGQNSRDQGKHWSSF